MRTTWSEPATEYGIKDFEPGCLVGSGSVIIFPELISMKAPSRIDSQVYLSVGIDMAPRSVICPGAKVIGGAGRKVVMGAWSFIGWNSLVISRSEDYRYLVGVGFGAPGPAIEGDVVFERYAGLGSMSTVLPGVTFPEGCLVGAHSLVHKSKDLIPWWVHKGVPARPWKPRDRERVLREAEEAEGRKA